MSRPVLAMLSPLDLPIWDYTSNYEFVDAWRNGDSVRLEFAGPVGRGHAIVDLENHVAVEQRYLDRLYTVRELSTTLHGDVGRTVWSCPPGVGRRLALGADPTPTDRSPYE